MHAVVSPRVAVLAIGAAILVGCSNDVPSPTGLASSADLASLTVNKPEFSVLSTAYDDIVFGVASNGSNTLVPYSSLATIGAKLYSSTGALLKTITTTKYGYYIQAAYGGDSYLVVWLDISTYEVWGMKVSSAGTAGTPFRVSPVYNGTTFYFPVGIAYGNGKFLVEYLESNTFKTKGRFVSFNPTKTLGTAFTIATSTYFDSYANMLASDGTNFLALYEANATAGTGLYARKINGSTGAVGSQVTIDQNVASDPLISASFSNGKYLVTFGKQRNTTALDVMGRFVTQAGATSGAAVVIDGASGNQVAVQGIKFGDGFLVTYMNSSNGAAKMRLVSFGNPVGAAQTLFTMVNGKIKVPSGAAIGTKVFFAADRGTPGSSTDITDLSDSDVRGIIVTP